MSTPGCVDGWFALHERFGRLPMAEVLAPAIGYALEGAPITPVIATYWREFIKALKSQARRGVLEELDNALQTFTRDEQTPAPGQIWTNPDLARTYELLATGGRDAFYKGAIARTIDGYMRRIGG